MANALLLYFPYLSSKMSHFAAANLFGDIFYVGYDTNITIL